MAIEPGRVKFLFQAAIERDDPDDRRAFVEREAGGDAELLARVLALLAAYDDPPDALDRPLAADAQATVDTDPATPPDSAPSPGPPAVEEATIGLRCGDGVERIDDVIAGRYRLRQEIGEGGMGAVYLAEQTRPVRRQVALKLIKPGMDSRAVLARFESERQALALMDHPHIAKVLDAGTTEQGRPFFVMELVKGVPLTDFCDQHLLDVPARLALFCQICSAVHHAHQKGIIHRDLKPSNILVESHDGRPMPRVIDFGLAKAVSGMQLSEDPAFTGLGIVAGTPLYMAPEQAGFNALDVDTRADIYALGVILYELLTGSTPIRRETLKRAAMEEMLRLIREEEPATPSSRISTSEALPNLAAHRQIEPGRLSRLVRGDLDWIVMKALSKERDRRYASAIGLANDVERFTNHEPVSAGPPTAAYRMRKFVRRNRGRVVAASLLLLALVGGIVGTTLGLLEATRQRGFAETEAAQKEEARQAEADQRREAETQRRAAVEQRRQAEARLAQVEKANAVLGSIFIDLNPRSAEKDGKPLSALLGERLDQATAQIEGDAIGDPLAVARMQLVLGDSQAGLGYPEKAIALVTKARATFLDRLGPDHLHTLASLFALAECYRALGKPDLALPLFQQALAARTRVLGPDHPITLHSMNGLAMGYRDAGKLDLALPLMERALAAQKAKLGPDDPATFVSMNNLAAVHRDMGRIDLALPLMERALAARETKLGPDHPDTLTLMNNLATGYQAVGKLDLALPLLERALAAREAKLGPDHPGTLLTMNNLAAGYVDADKPGLALPLMERALAAQKSKLGLDHPETLLTMNNLASVYRNVGKLDLAVPLLEQTLEARKAKLGLDHPDTLRSMNDLAALYRDAGKPDLARPMMEQALEARKAKLGLDHPDTLKSMNDLAGLYRAAGKLDLARPLMEQALASARSKLGPDHPITLAAMNQLGLVYQSADKFDLALPMMEQALAMRKAKFGDDHPETVMSMNDLAALYRIVGRIDLALQLMERALAARETKLGPDHPDTLTLMNNLATGYQTVGKLDLALPLLERTLAARKTKLGPDHPETLLTMNNLAAAYRDVGKLDLALPLLEEALAAARSKLGPDHPDTLLSMNNLASIYWSSRRLDRSIPLFEEVLKLRMAKFGADHHETWLVKANLGVNYRDAGRLDEALPLLEGAAAASRRLPMLSWVAPELLQLLARTGRAEKARAVAEEVLAQGRAAMPAGSPQLAAHLCSISLALLAVKAYDQAEPLLREALAIREKADPDAWTTFNTKSMLGGALLGQAKSAEAEPLLRDGYDGMRRRTDKIPPQGKARVVEALDRLIVLAEAAGKDEDAKAWRAEREKAAADAPKPEGDGK